MSILFISYHNEPPEYIANAFLNLEHLQKQKNTLITHLVTDGKEQIIQISNVSCEVFTPQNIDLSTDSKERSRLIDKIVRPHVTTGTIIYKDTHVPFIEAIIHSLVLLRGGKHGLCCFSTAQDSVHTTAATSSQSLPEEVRQQRALLR